MKQIMRVNKAKKLFLALTVILLVSILSVFFQTDLRVVSNQVTTEIGVASEVISPVFAIKEGYVQYVPEESADELQYPLLSEVHARLHIPRLGIEGAIVEGKDEKMLDQGFWHYPSASPFSAKGNVVIIGHRFLKLPPHRDTFYHLNWVKSGDEITIKTSRGMIRYRVREQRIVSVNDTYVLQQTLNAQITLITCHPLWTSKERLVIIGDRIEESNDTEQISN
ncbi:class D sortase [bacterium]|nr:class D sortase [bacterium]